MKIRKEWRIEKKKALADATLNVHE